MLRISQPLKHYEPSAHIPFYCMFIIDITQEAEWFSLEELFE